MFGGYFFVSDKALILCIEPGSYDAFGVEVCRCLPLLEERMRKKCLFGLHTFGRSGNQSRLHIHMICIGLQASRFWELVQLSVVSNQ